MSFSKRVLSIPDVSPLRFGDEPLFRVAFPKDAVYYSRSWLYVLRAAHMDDGSLGYKYLSSDLVVVIGKRNGYVYVTPILDTTRGIRLRQLCENLIEKTGYQVILKKLLPTILAAESQFDAEVQHPGTAALPLEDDTVAESLLRLDKLFVGASDKLNPVAKRVARKVQAFENRGGHPTIQNDISQVPLEAIEVFLRQWPAKYASYIPMVRYLHGRKDDSHFYRCMIFMEKDEVRGVYLAEKMSLNEIGLYCGVTARNQPGVTEWMDITFFRALLHEGFKEVYLGGSESAGISHFCTKLLPYKPSYTVRATLYRPLHKDNAFTIRLATQYDVTPLATVYKQVYNELDALGERWTRETAHTFISHFYRRQPDLFFVAAVDGTVVGGAVAAIQPWWDGNHLVEGEVFVDPRYADQGIEKQLLKQLLVAARDSYHVVAWDTLMPVVGKHAFAKYETIGFNEMPNVRAITADMSTMLARLGESGLAR